MIVRIKREFFENRRNNSILRDLAMIPSLSDSEIKFEIVIESKNTTFLKTAKGRGSMEDVELYIIINLWISKMEGEEKLDNIHKVISVILWAIIYTKSIY